MRPLKTFVYLAGAALAVVYVINPGAGIVELIPDNLPFVGNIDEATMTALFLFCVRRLRQLKSDKRAALLIGEGPRRPSHALASADR